MREQSVWAIRSLVCAAAACLCSAVLYADEARFSGRIVVELLEGMELDHKLKLLDDFRFADRNGRVWLAPSGAIIDGASIPRELRDLTGLPFVAEYRKASVIHDYYCQAKSERWRDVHRMFYDAALTEGVNDLDAKVLYAAVYAGGWRWEPRGTSCFRSCHAAAESLGWKPVVTEAMIQPIIDWTRQSNPTLDEIEQRVDAVTKKPGPHLFAQGH